MSSSDAGYPAEPYKYRDDAPHVAPNRPLSQGDVFLDIPLVGGAVPDARHEGVWKSKSRNGLGLFITHPCASRSSTTYRLHEYVSVAPVVKSPRGFEPPWDGYYDLCPLPGLRNGEDYVAKLNEACPVPTAALEGQRIAVLTVEGLVALFHRLAMNSLRFPETPTRSRRRRSPTRSTSGNDGSRSAARVMGSRSGSINHLAASPARTLAGT